MDENSNQMEIEQSNIVETNSPNDSRMSINQKTQADTTNTKSSVEEQEVDISTIDNITEEDILARRQKALQSTSDWNSDLLKIRQEYGPYYYDIHTKTTQVLSSWMVEFVYSDDWVEQKNRAQEDRLRRELKQRMAGFDFKLNIPLPRVAMQAFMAFAKKQRAKIKVRQPSANLTEMSKMAGSYWKQMTPEKRKKWEDRAKKDKEIHQIQMEEYRKRVEIAKSRIWQKLPKLVLEGVDLETIDYNELAETASFGDYPHENLRLNEELEYYKKSKEKEKIENEQKRQLEQQQKELEKQQQRQQAALQRKRDKIAKEEERIAKELLKKEQEAAALKLQQQQQQPPIQKIHIKFPVEPKPPVLENPNNNNNNNNNNAAAVVEDAQKKQKREKKTKKEKKEKRSKKEKKDKKRKKEKKESELDVSHLPLASNNNNNNVAIPVVATVNQQQQQKPASSTVATSTSAAAVPSTCKSCGKHTSGNQTLCADCKQLIDAGQFCPICRRAYRDDEPAPMIQCDICDSWIHAACDNISDKEYEQLTISSNSKYTCPICRAKPASEIDRFLKNKGQQATGSSVTKRKRD